MRTSDQPLPQPPNDDRPGDDWICGWTDAGMPCQHGPSGKGDCPALASCRPRQDDQSPVGWVCHRPACLGGPCEAGPDASGTCGLTPEPCTPKRSWRNRRRVAASLCFLSSIGFVLIALGGPWRTEAFAPGGLVQPHAQILGGELKSDRCASCHPAARGGLFDWFFDAGNVHAGVTQTQLCMDCHHKTIDMNTARSAHNLSPAQLQLISNSISERSQGLHGLLPYASVDMHDIACATCHREHHGGDNDLSALTSQQCQACHKNRFSSFAHGHPQWSDWPYGKRDRIAFDHATHLNKHFAKDNTKFDCKICHQATVDQEIGRTASFEQAARAVIKKPLRIGIDEGLAIVQFPMLDTQAMSAAGHVVEAWPDDARGVFDGKLSPVLRLLLRSDPATRDVLKRLPVDGNIGHFNPSNPQDMADAKRLADAICRLTDALADDGYEAIAKRLSHATGLDESTVGKLAARLSPQLISAARMHGCDKMHRL
ncbi:MAG: hypothetical protein R3C05_25290 [Pirellulaceae bacterium]